MSDSTGLVSGVSGRYATALFELADEADSFDAVEKDLATLSVLIRDSADLRDVIHSPLCVRGEQVAALTAVGDKAGICRLVGNFISLMAKNRRLFALDDAIAGFGALLADRRGEVTARVATPVELSARQIDDLKATLKKGIGKEVMLKITMDESLIGGLVVKVGSKMIDTSICSQLANLQTAMREVG